MRCSWSLASRAVLFSVVVATLAWGVSGLVFWTTMTSEFGVVLWLIGGVAALLGVRIFSQRWVRHSLTQPLSEIEDMLRTLSVGERPHFRRYAAAELNSIATAIERVTERIESVEQSVEHLQKVRSQFLANVSHELRTPLFAIEGYLETLLDGALDDSAVARNFLEKAYANVQRLSTLLGDLVEIARIESGEMRMSFRYFDVADLARTITQQFEQQAQQQNVALTVSAPAEMLAYGDRDRIGQVLANLISNAIKYNVPGGKVLVRVEREDGRVAISVEDTGIGIAPEHQPRVFERFYRTDAARSRSVGGSGLGLAIVKHILEAHRAPFELQSEVGKGTTIRFWLKS